MEKNMSTRAIAATAQYLRRLGWRDVLVREGAPASFLTGADGEETVVVLVVIGSAGSAPAVDAIAWPRLPEADRIDCIGLALIGQDRALIRHYRGVR